MTRRDLLTGRAELDLDKWAGSEIVISFEDVSFVSPSFLDETSMRLAEDRPDVATRVVIRRLSPFTARRLRSILEHRNLKWTLRQREEEGEYEVASQVGNVTSIRVPGRGEQSFLASSEPPSTVNVGGRCHRVARFDHEP